MTPTNEPAVHASYLPSALGEVLIASTTRGVCAVALGDDRAALERALRELCPDARAEAPSATQARWAADVVRAIDGGATAAIPLDVEATPFQRRVWDALCAIPRGGTRTYAQIARAIGAPATAARAVGTACGQNPVSVLVPCHRVLRGDGALGGYRWGVERKRALLLRERALLA